ncbi:hypothetical protein A9798_05795 [Edwardsiella hoshinae]|uniref:Uncharacterized protein n=1 Tax=Edwardsiella hoshinae TaxID=93378 RepID=A0ABM6EHL9_9GAMM|nr:hypothetical protein A9798_05795 [Edwardsiella hoshinae]
MMRIAYPSQRADVVPKRSGIVPNRSFDAPYSAHNDRSSIVIRVTAWHTVTGAPHYLHRPADEVITKKNVFPSTIVRQEVSLYGKNPVEGAITA